MSTRWVGCSISSFIRSSRLVPPLMNLAPALRHGGDRGAWVGRPLVGEGSHRRASFRDVANGRDDVRIGGAATDVAAHPLADLRVGQRDRAGRHVGGGVAGPAGLRLGEHADGRADLAGGAVAALEAVVLDEGGLQRVQGARRAETFDRHDLVALVHDGERQARVDAPAVDQHRAGAALPVVAALLGAGQVQVLAQRVEQRRARVQLEAAAAGPLTVNVTFALLVSAGFVSRAAVELMPGGLQGNVAAEWRIRSSGYFGLGCIPKTGTVR